MNYNNEAAYHVLKRAGYIRKIERDKWMLNKDR